MCSSSQLREAEASHALWAIRFPCENAPPSPLWGQLSCRLLHGSRRRVPQRRPPSRLHRDPGHSCRSARAVESFAAGNGGDASVCLGIPFGPWMAAGFVAYARSLWRPTWSRSDLTCERRSIYVSARCRHAHRDPRHPLWQLRCAPPATGTRRRDAHLQLLQRGYLARTHLAEETSSTQAPAHCARNA